MQTNDYLARVEQAVRESLRGAQVIALVEDSIVTNANGYWERSYFVAWQRTDQCGTHRVHVNSDGDSSCFIGHYDMIKPDAIDDMLKRRRA